MVCLCVCVLGGYLLSTGMSICPLLKVHPSVRLCVPPLNVLGHSVRSVMRFEDDCERKWRGEVLVCRKWLLGPSSVFPLTQPLAATSSGFTGSFTRTSVARAILKPLPQYDLTNTVSAWAWSLCNSIVFVCHSLVSSSVSLSYPQLSSWTFGPSFALLFFYCFLVSTPFSTTLKTKSIFFYAQPFPFPSFLSFLCNPDIIPFFFLPPL